MSIAQIKGDLCTKKTLHDKSLKTWQFIKVCVECVWRIWQSCNMEQAKNKLQYCCSSRYGHADFVRAWSRGICLWISFLFRFLYTWYSLVCSLSDSNSTQCNLLWYNVLNCDKVQTSGVSVMWQNIFLDLEKISEFWKDFWIVNCFQFLWKLYVFMN